MKIPLPLKRYIDLREEFRKHLKRPLEEREKRFIFWVITREIQEQQESQNRSRKQM